jgi:zinc D-Ala-D-Ala carboxypeptidase
MTQLTEHFALSEFTASTTAAQCGIENTPTPEAMINLEQLAMVMEEVRKICSGAPVIITSGYRCEELNTACGGAADSAHMYGLACDFLVPDFGSPLSVCKAVEPYMYSLGIDQLIHEAGQEAGEHDDWTHLAIAVPVEAARCECLTISASGCSEGFA